jgi:chemotaxis protein methyltransferase CheR
MFEFIFGNDKSKNQEFAQDEVEYKKIEDFSSIFEYIYNNLGISELEKRRILQDKLNLLANNNGIHNVEQFLDKLKKRGKFYEDVIDIVTVNETYFFREMDTLKQVVEFVRLQNKKIRILSMPCSNGAEIYSILILLNETDSSLLQRVEITGIDICHECIRRAKEGVYTKRELHKLSLEQKERYFTKIDEEYRAKQFLSNCNVRFEAENIFELTPQKYGYFDIILSRNLFIYFDKSHRVEAAAKLCNMLNTNGYLIMGVSDRFEPSGCFKKITGFIYKKVGIG